MYTLKSYFLIADETDLIQQMLVRYPELQIADAKVVTEADDADDADIQVLEAPDASLVEVLKQEFGDGVKEYWNVPARVDFAITLPQAECNSFVLPVYGNFRDASRWVKKWQEASWKETNKFYPVLISCHKTQEASWVEFRGHTEMPDEYWFENVRKICKHFTKSNPTFFRAEKLW